MILGIIIGVGISLLILFLIGAYIIIIKHLVRIESALEILLDEKATFQEIIEKQEELRKVNVN